MKQLLPRDSEARQQAPATPAAAAPAPDRASGVVWCQERACQAVVSTVRRDLGAKILCYVQWCSLLGIDVACDERCIFSSTQEGERDVDLDRAIRE